LLKKKKPLVLKKICHPADCHFFGAMRGLGLISLSLFTNHRVSGFVLPGGGSGRNFPRENPQRLFLTQTQGGVVVLFFAHKPNRIPFFCHPSPFLVRGPSFFPDCFPDDPQSSIGLLCPPFFFGSTPFPFRHKNPGGPSFGVFRNFVPSFFTLCLLFVDWWALRGPNLA